MKETIGDGDGSRVDVEMLDFDGLTKDGGGTKGDIGDEVIDDLGDTDEVGEHNPNGLFTGKQVLELFLLAQVTSGVFAVGIGFIMMGFLWVQYSFYPPPMLELVVETMGVTQYGMYLFVYFLASLVPLGLAAVSCLLYLAFLSGRHVGLTFCAFAVAAFLVYIALLVGAFAFSRAWDTAYDIAKEGMEFGIGQVVGGLESEGRWDLYAYDMSVAIESSGASYSATSCWVSIKLDVGDEVPVAIIVREPFATAQDYPLWIVNAANDTTPSVQSLCEWPPAQLGYCAYTELAIAPILLSCLALLFYLTFGSWYGIRFCNARNDDRDTSVAEDDGIFSFLILGTISNVLTYVFFLFVGFSLLFDCAL